MSTQISPEHETLSHLANRLLAREGGTVALETLAITAQDEFDIEGDIESLVDEHAGDVYAISRADDGQKVISSVSPVGDEPDEVAAHFDTADLTDLDGVTADIAPVLRDLGYDSFEALAEVESHTLFQSLQDELDERAKEVDVDELLDQFVVDNENEPIISALLNAGYSTYRQIAKTSPESLANAADNHIVDHLPEQDLTELEGVTNSQETALKEALFDNYRVIEEASVAELADAAATINEARAEVIQDEAASKATHVDKSDAASIKEAASQLATDVSGEQVETIIDAAADAIPVTPKIAQKHADRYQARTDANGSGTARVTQIETVTQEVPDPRYHVLSDVNPGDREHRYISDIGTNEDDPVETALPINHDDGHPSIPKPETHPNAGDDALPVDGNGEVIPPAVPTEPRLQIPMDVLLANKLARGITPVCVQGPRGAGKNYLIKYLAYRTNNGYRSIDADRTTTPDDLFGPLTPDEDGIITPRNGPVKQALLNGEWLVINEFPTMQAGALMALHRLLNEGKLLIKAHGELVEPHPLARIIVTMNPPTREYRDSEPMNSATRERFRRFQHTYPQDVDIEAKSVAQQVNRNWRTVSEDTIKELVEFAHKTRDKQSWPTVSTRSLIICSEHIDDGASPRAAMKNVLWAVAEPNQNPESAHQTLNDIINS